MTDRQAGWMAFMSTSEMHQWLATARQLAVTEGLAKQRTELAEAAKAAAINGKSDRSMKNEIAVVKAFKKAGFGNTTPHVDVMTFNRWVAKGWRPVKGTKSLRVKNLRLFHKSQCRPITSEERKAMTEQSTEAVKRHERAAGKVVPIHEEASPQ
jgi:hypothetical protein